MKHAYPILLCTLLCACTSTTAQTTEEYNTGGPITGLNTVDLADSYPWISSDGLRLYFSRTDIAGESRIHRSTRATISAAFTTSVAVLPGFDDDQISCWLDQDELTMLFSSNYTLMRASRASTADPFGAPVSVTLSGASGLFVSPTMTADGSELLVTAQTGVMRFSNTGPDAFTFVETLTIGSVACKLSADGLQLFTSASFGGVVRPCRLSRTTLADEFTNAEYYTSSIIVAGSSWSQPHLSTDNGILVLARNQATWTSNDLFLFERTDLTAVGMIARHDLLMWPNPAVDQINIQLPETGGARIERVRLFDAQGRVVLDRAGSTGYLATLDLDAQSEGAYLLEARLSDGTRLSDRIVVVR